MYQVTVDYAKANLDELCDRAGQEPEGVAIVRENRSYILITQEKWESLIETAELMQLPNLLTQVATDAPAQLLSQ
jgi:PHD/YefM family antitoxin component YafN of YafNO toxin-antitoxin module